MVNNRQMYRVINIPTSQEEEEDYIYKISSSEDLVWKKPPTIR